VIPPITIAASSNPPIISRTIVSVLSPSSCEPVDGSDVVVANAVVGGVSSSSSPDAVVEVVERVVVEVVADDDVGRDEVVTAGSVVVVEGSVVGRIVNAVVVVVDSVVVVVVVVRTCAVAGRSARTSTDTAVRNRTAHRRDMAADVTGFRPGASGTTTWFDPRPSGG
jgi:hypothetical protein